MKNFSGNEVVVGQKSIGRLEVYIKNCSPCNIIIGNNVCIKNNVIIYCCNSTYKKISPGPIIIEDGTIIEEGVTIYPNVIVRKNQIVPAGTILGIDVPSTTS